MKRLIPAIAILLGWAAAAWATTPATLTTLNQIHALTNAEASKSLPVAFEATVTYARAFARTSFMQDGVVAIFVLVPVDAKLEPGDRVLVRGTTRPSFRPIVVSESITLLHHGALPAPVPASYDELIHSQHDAVRVTVHAVVQTADFISSQEQSIFLRMIADDGYINALVESSDASLLKGLLDAEVEVTGVAAGSFDNKMQLTGIQIHVSSMADVKILKRASTSPWNLPATSMDTIVTGYRIRDLTARVRVHGTITYYQPGSAVVLQDGAKSLWIGTRTYNNLKIGDLADAIGFPEVRDGFLILARSEVEDNHIPAPIAPLQANWQSLTLNDTNNFGHVYDLVSIEGQVLTEAREALQDQYVLMSDGHLTTAIYRRSDEASPAQAMKRIPLGSKVRVSGICVLDDSNPFNGPVPFNILLRTTDDITVVAKPSLLSTRNLLLALGGLLIVVFVVIARGWVLERKMKRQAAVLSARTEVEVDLERRRSGILQAINESRPLPVILLQITAMVSTSLDGAPCWCEIVDGGRLGDCPAELESLRLAHASIEGRLGSALGTLFAGLNPETLPTDRETVALRNGARLATLAIESFRIHSDTGRSPDDDLSTDGPNRFASISAESPFLLGKWLVEPEFNRLSSPDATHNVEPKVMGVLLQLAMRAENVVSKDEILRAVWPKTFVSEDAVTRCISVLRHILEDDPQNPRFIKTVFKVGYCLLVPATPLESLPVVAIPDSSMPKEWKEQQPATLLQKNRPDVSSMK
jgi:DNA-binding winged helix-turn-helix (wHTH) protein